MGTKRHGLGRGLDALLGAGAPHSLLDQEAGQELRMVAVDRIQRGRYQPRRYLRSEPLEELAHSIREQGVVQPIVVRPLDEDGSYELIVGERRWRASQMAGLDEIPAIIRHIPDQAALSVALIENVQREDLSPLEEAGALARLVDEFDMTHQQVADAVGRSRAAVTNLLRLLELDDQVKRMLEGGDLEMGHARALLPLKGGAQRRAAEQMVARQMSVREAERVVRRLLDPPDRKLPRNRAKDPNIAGLESELSEKLGAAVALRHKASGKGMLVIRYNSLDELDGIIGHIKGSAKN